MSELEKISQKFGNTYLLVKKYTDDKEKAQKALFAAFTKELEKKRLPRKTIDVSDIPEEDREEWIAQYHPGWRIVTIEDPAKGIIERDPAKMKHTYINRTDGYVYGRTEVEGAVSLDEERLKEDDWDLWMSITTWPEPWYSILVECFPDDPSLPNEILEYHNIERELKPQDQWTPEQTKKVEKYLVPGPVSVKLVPPRKAKEEELEEAKEEE